jgi:formylaminopyrimidine deformylase
MNQIERIMQEIDASREEMADLCVDFANTFSPATRERAIAERVYEWYEEQGFEARVVPITDERACTVAHLRGTGGGKSLLFNAHLDTEASGPDYDNLMQTPDVNRRGGWREGDRLFGHTLLNDRHGHVLMMYAARALREAGVSLPGDIILTSVAGETGSAPVDEYRGIGYEGKGFGTQYLVNNGVRANFGLVAETTGFAPCWYNCGAAYIKVVLRGKAMYTPRLERPESGDLNDHPNAIVKAAEAVKVVEAWGVRIQAERTADVGCGEVSPKTQVGAIRGGIPWRPNRSAPYCALYVDVRTRPGEDPLAFVLDLQNELDGAGIDADVSLIMARAGADGGEKVKPLVGAVGAAHQVVRGEPMRERAESPVVSMWRDNNILNNSGIPAMNFGPSRGRAAVQGTGFMEVDDLVDGAKIYALTALQIAGGQQLTA